MIVIDNFLPDELLEGLMVSSTMRATKNNGYRWWDGVTKENKVHEIIAYCRDYFEVQGVCGFEWWYNAIEGVANQWHFDRDEERYEKGEHMPAEWSCTLYPFPHTIWGGFLEVECGDETRTEVERIAPRFNRCVVLDKCVWHRVSRVWSGQRHSLTINGYIDPPSSAY